MIRIMLFFKRDALLKQGGSLFWWVFGFGNPVFHPGHFEAATPERGESVIITDFRQPSCPIQILQAEMPKSFQRFSFCTPLLLSKLTLIVSCITCKIVSVIKALVYEVLHPKIDPFLLFTCSNFIFGLHGLAPYDCFHSKAHKTNVFQL